MLSGEVSERRGERAFGLPGACETLGGEVLYWRRISGLGADMSGNICVGGACGCEVGVSGAGRGSSLDCIKLLPLRVCRGSSPLWWWALEGVELCMPDSVEM